MPLLPRGTQRDKLEAKVDTLGIEPRASRMLSGCDTTTPCAHLLALEGLSSMRVPPARIPSQGHGRNIIKLLQRRPKGESRKSQNGT